MNKLLAVLLACLAMPTNATLLDRGGGLIYDDVLNITWLQDANYAKTSGFDADGLMDWHAAMAWAVGLIYGGYDDWRLPIVNPANGQDFTYTYSPAGFSDFGYNIKNTSSEMAYMHHNNLGNISLLIPNGDFSGCQNNVPDMCMYNKGYFSNLQSYTYWSMTEIPTDSAFNFNMSTGGQGGSTKTGDVFYAWAVRDGDVTPVPEPSTYALILGGLGVLVVALRRNSKQVV